MEIAEEPQKEQPVKVQRGFKTSIQQISSICRGCLATGVEMRGATLLNSVFKNLTGIDMSVTDMLCYECSALLRKYNRFRNKILVSQDMLTRYPRDCVPFTNVNVASPHLTRTSVHTYEYLAIQTEQVKEIFLPDVSDKPVVVKQETVEVKEGPLHDCDAITEEWREPSPFTSELWRSRPVKCYTKKKRTVTPKTEVQTEQTEKMFDLLGIQAASVESVVVTDAVRHSLRARLRFDDHSYARVPEESSLTTSINSYADTPEIDIQEHFLELGFMKFEVENPSDRDDYTCDYEIYANSYQEYDKSDATSLHDNDSAERDVKCSIDRGGSVFSSSHNNVQSYTRNECISVENLLTEHIREHSLEKSFKCDVCHKLFPDECTLTKHSHVHTAAMLYHCDMCNKSYCHKRKIIQHLRKHSNEKLYSGDVSKKKSKRDTSVTAVRTGDTPYKCDVCMKYLATKSTLKMHLRQHTGETPFVCDICNKCYTQKYNLEHHVRVHTGYKPYKCEVCMKRFNWKGDLKRHLLTHIGDKPYKCDLCIKSFRRKHHLETHMFMHTGEHAQWRKQHKCDVCMKSFSSKPNLSRHFRIHTGEKPFKCDRCAKSFSDKSGLKGHMLVHTGDKPYKCDVCMKCFRRRAHLKAHMRLHTGVKPFKCDLCMKSFTEKVSLRRHIHAHTGYEPYKCNICMKSFALKATFNKHYRTHTTDAP